MRTIAAFAVMLALAGCGGQQSGDGAQTDASAGGDPVLESCLDLVARAEYEDAVPACVEAVEEHPDSQRARAALDQARDGLANIDAAGAALEEEAARIEGEARALSGQTAD